MILPAPPTRTAHTDRERDTHTETHIRARYKWQMTTLYYLYIHDVTAISGSQRTSPSSLHRHAANRICSRICPGSSTKHFAMAATRAEAAGAELIDYKAIPSGEK